MTKDRISEASAAAGIIQAAEIKISEAVSAVKTAEETTEAFKASGSRNEK